jgi:hypothetical protein
MGRGQATPLALLLATALLGCDGGAPPPTLPPDVLSFSHPAGVYAEAIELSLGGPPDAVIRVTVDGSAPTEGSPAYGGPLRIERTTTVRARLFRATPVGREESRAYVRVDGEVRAFSSNLSIALLDSFGHDIDAESGSEEDRPSFPRRPVHAAFFAAPEGGRATLDGPGHAGRAGVRVRGNSSQILPKKQYSLELWDADGDDVEAPLLGMPEESDWALLAPYGDKSLMRDHLGYRWGAELGLRAPRTRFVELFFDQDDGVITMDDYAGVYLLVETNKRGRDRIDLSAAGHVLKVDVPDPDERPFATARGTPPLYPALGFLHVYPAADRITPAEDAAIRAALDDFEAALFDGAPGAYAPFIDAASFVDYHLFTEALKNADGFYASFYMHREEGGPLVLGPLWDWNVAFGGTTDWDAFDPRGWLGDEVAIFWFPELLADPAFRAQWLARWAELRAGLLATDHLLADIDATASLLEEAQQRNFARWPILGREIEELPHINPPGAGARTTYASEVEYLRSWLVERLAWIDANTATL